ncbi:hypothetical protein [Tsukamurella tyrosinosolvens]|uniref:hypothetical protein n=1 Tax=Tsukamurella tyrosinosolvens TaxID=57704 RepID=UPI003F4A5B49
MDQPEIPLSLAEAAPYFGRRYEWLLAQAKGPLKPFVLRVGRNYFMTPSQIRAAQQTYAVAATASEVEPQRRPNTRGPHSFDHL